MPVMGMKVEVVSTVRVVKCGFPNSGGPCTTEELWSRELPGLGMNFLSYVMALFIIFSSPD